MRRRIAHVALALAAASSGCSDRPSGSELFTEVRVLEVGAGETRIADEAAAIVANAERACWLAAETLDGTQVADALVAAQQRGLDVRVVGDVDLRDQPGFRRLAEQLRATDGGIPMRFGDGPLVYNPQLVDTVARAGDHNRMSHDFLVCDERTVLTTTGGFGSAPTRRLAVRFDSLYAGRDFADEFAQLYAGVFATTLSAFNGPLKSVTDNREWYDADTGRVEVYFGPQERPVKRVVDAVYAARSGVWVVAEELTSLPVADALRYKAEAGFDVVVIVSEAGRGVPSSRYDSLARSFATLENARIGTSAQVGFTSVVVDPDPSPIDGVRYARSAYVFSAPLLAATSIVEGQTTTARASDAFTDSNLVVFTQWPGSASPAFEAVATVVASLLGEAR